jgi:hypothetical protein
MRLPIAEVLVATTVGGTVLLGLAIDLAVAWLWLVKRWR